VAFEHIGRLGNVIVDAYKDHVVGAHVDSLPCTHPSFFYRIIGQPEPSQPASEYPVLRGTTPGRKDVQVGLSDTQLLFRDTTRRLLDERGRLDRVRELIDDPVGFDPAVWAMGGELGWFALLVPEKYGGGTLSGSGLEDATIVAEELGRMLQPGPFHATNVVAFALSEYGSGDQKERFLPGLARGEAIATWAFAEPNRDWDTGTLALEAVPVDDGWVLNGVKTCVQDAQQADLLLVTASSGPRGLTQFAIPAATPGITIEPLECLDLTRRMADLSFVDVRVDTCAIVGEPGGASEAVERQLQVALVLQCADTNGATDAGLAMTVQYAKDRVAFGRPIGSYQALKHRMADHRMWLEGSFATTAHAASSVQADSTGAAVAARIAKAHVGRRSTAILHDCIQIHGGIGMTWEYDLHLYFRRAISNEVLYGTPYYHARALVDLAERRPQ
jgi:alkylation response protein AidB-like acyl-CoA dehydrogenase